MTAVGVTEAPVRALHETTPEHKVFQIASRGTVTIPMDDLIVDGALEIYSEVESKGYFSIQFGGRQLQITAGAYVGLIPVNSHVTLDIRPKLPVNNLARIIELSEEGVRAVRGTERKYLTRDQSTSSVLEFLAVNLLESLREIELRGIYKVYRVHASNTSRPRGRIDARRTVTMNVNKGIVHKVYALRYTHTVDSPYNRLLKHALWFLAQRFRRMANRNRALMKDLNRALADYEAVTLDTSPALVAKVRRALAADRIPTARGYYEKPLRIALTVVAGKGVSLLTHGGEIDLAAYVVNFDDLFEAYVRQVLRAALSDPKCGIRVLDGNLEGKRSLFDDRRTPSAQPDVIVRTAAGTVVLVEVKYKEKISRADVNQAIVYGVSYRANDVVLVHVSSSRTGSVLGTIGPLTIHTYGFELGAKDLQEEEVVLATEVRSLAAV